jgi:hypothetical protein
LISSTVSKKYRAHDNDVVDVLDAVLAESAVVVMDRGWGVKL